MPLNWYVLQNKAEVIQNTVGTTTFHIDTYLHVQ